MLNFRKPETALDAPDQFIQDLVPVWSRVERFEIYRVRKGEPSLIATSDVMHLSDAPDTPDNDVRQLRMYLEDDAKTRGEPTRYQVIARGTKHGPPVKAAKGKVTPGQEIPNAELASWTPRFGDAEIGERTQADPMAVITNFLKTVPDIYNGGISAADAAMKLHITANASLVAENNALRGENMALRAERSQGEEFRFKLAELQVHAAQQERAETREDQRLESEAKQKSETIEKAMSTITALMHMVIEDRKAERASREAAASASSSTKDEAAESPRQGPHIGRELRAAISHLTEAQNERMTELCGKVEPEPTQDPSKIGRPGLAIWEVIVGASKRETHEDAVATLNNIVASKKTADTINEALRTATQESILTVDQANVVVSAMRFVTKRA